MVPLLFTVTLLAQQGSRATLNGTVEDQTGAVIPKAKVVATNLATGVASDAVTTSAGVYTILGLPPGEYTVTASHAGFSSATVLNVPLRVAQLLTINLKLKVGGGTQTVKVSDEQLLETSTAQISHYVTKKEMLSWPIPVTGDGERQLQSFIFRSLPGATGETFLGSINGGQYFSNEIYIDGISLGTFDTAELGPSVDAVGAFNLQSGSMGAQYNGGGTAVSNFEIESGTNKFHGSLYEYLQNEDLNANSYDANTFDTGKPKQRLNDFGFTIGGPVWIPKVYDGRKKTFFFLSYERTIKRNFTIEGATNLATQNMRAGDLSGFLDPSMTNDPRSGQPAYTLASDGVTEIPVEDALGRKVIYGQIYDPGTTRFVTKGEVDPVTGLTAVSTGLVRDPFPNNQIPKSRMNSVAQKYLALPYTPTFINNQVVSNVAEYAGNQPVFNQGVWTFKIDQVIDPRNKVSFYMTTTSRKRSQSGAATWSLPGSNPLDTWDDQNTPGKIVRLNDYWALSPNVFNRFGIGYNRFTNEYTTDFYNQNWASKLGLQNLPSIGFPTVSFGGARSLGGGIDEFGNGAVGAGSIDQSTIFTDQVSMSHGRHQLVFGTEWRYYNENDQNISGQPNFSFSNISTDDGTSTDNYTGNAFASFLLGQVNSTGRTVYAGDFGFRRRQVGTYLQDNWHVNRRLNLNLGLRWEVLTGIKEVRGQMTTFDPTLPNAAAGGLPGALEFASQMHRKGFENTDWGLILPRFGFAFEATPRLVWRGGFGVNTQAPEGGPQLQFQGNPSTLGYSGSIVANQDTNPQPYPDIAPFTLGEPYPTYTAPLPNYDPTQANGASSSPPQYVRPDGTRVAYVENYTFGFQMDLTHKTVAEVNYIGNTSRRLYAYGTDQMNQLPLSDLSYGDVLLDPLYEHPGIAAPYAGFNTNLQVNQALAPFPQYAGGGISQYDSHFGWSRYDSLQATITRHVSKGLSILVAYTWSKTLTNTNSNCNSGYCGSVQNVYNLKGEKAVANAINVPQQAKVTFIYDLPFGKGRLVNLHGPLDLIAGGWTLSGNLIYQSGDVLNIFDGGVNNGIFATTRPNFTGQPVELNAPGQFDVATGTGPHYLNPAAFAHVKTSCDLVASGTPCNNVALEVGNVPSALDKVVGPGLADENFSLQKDFAIGKTRYIQVRADAFNAFNRAGRGNPDTNINDATFGEITGPGTDSQAQDADSYFYQPRVVQVALRVKF